MQHHIDRAIVIPLDSFAIQEGVKSVYVKKIRDLLKARGYAAPTKIQLAEWHRVPKDEKLRKLVEWITGFDLVVFVVNCHGFVVPGAEELVFCLMEYASFPIEENVISLTELRMYDELPSIEFSSFDNILGWLNIITCSSFCGPAASCTITPYPNTSCNKSSQGSSN